MKLIKFFTERHKENIGIPIPIKNVLPEWYKNSESTFLKNNKELAGLKKCMPFVDGLMSGYAIVFPTDVEVLIENGKTIFNYDESLVGKFINSRPHELGATIPRPEGFDETHYAFTGYWGVKTPKGFSLLVTHPLNRSELPFFTLSAIMDSDEFTSPGNIPFFLKSNFQGIIKAGTPIAQMIPIKRESWVMVSNYITLLKKSYFLGKLARDKEYNYKRTMWHRKEYK